ncbi:MAG: sensor histidine kinase [Bacteroidota bacterium]
MAKETAHQLGTPLSSLMAWMEMLKMKKVDESILSEMEKDIFRLNHVTQRFSKIGSDVNLTEENIVPVIEEAVEYLKNRTSKNILYRYGFSSDDVVVAPVNKYLFQWVIENLCKNAVDAMNGKGKVAIELNEDEKWVYVDVIDNGKGINRDDLKQVFEPGFTSKKRGWGLGLTLARRIIEYYHKGKIMVKKSVPGQGSVFRIQLKKQHKA